MPIHVADTVAGFMNWKFYVVGHCSMKSEVMVVFNIETQMWEPGMILLGKEAHHICCNGCVVMMADKIYAKYNLNSFVYLPNKNNWEMDEMLNSKDWDDNPCVIDDILYYYDRNENYLRTYDPKQRCWGVVKGLEELLAEVRCPHWSESVRYGRNLALNFCKREGVSSRTKETIWSAEISLERRHGGKI